MFQGAKGGGGSFKQTPDNLRSTDTFEGVLGLCVGPIKGPVRGLKSIKLDGTPIENETGELNFQDFVALVADGDPTKFPQKVQLKLGAGASPMPVNLTIANPNNGEGQATPGPWITRTLTSTNADFIDIRFIVQQLYRQDKKGIYETTATLEIEMKPTGSTNWINPIGTAPTGTYDPVVGKDIVSVGQAVIKAFFGEKNFNSNGTWRLGATNFTLKGKTSGPSVYELRIAVPNDGAYANTQWDVRVRLLERDDWQGGDDGEKQEKRNIAWESMSAVYGSIMGEHEDWRGLAWAQLYGKASDQLTGVPEIEGEYYTKIVSTPPVTVFNPTTRQYTSTIWDGSWAKAYTNDPAWVISDAISDPLSGLALIAEGSYLNKWDALELSKWCSQLVPDGNGGTEPRYSLNIAVTEPQKAEEFVRYLGGAVGALLWDQGDGQWRCKVDKPEPAADIFTLDNIEGEFVYSHTDIDTRYNDIIGKFINEEMEYREDSVRLFDNASIAQIGRKPTTIALVGCTGRQEAMRRVKLRLRATVNEYKIVSFTTNRRGRNIEPLSTILIADGDLGDQDARTTGRIVNIDATRTIITVRDPMRLEQGVSYTLKFAKPNPDYSPDRTNQPGVNDWKNPTLIYSRNVMNASGERGNVTVIKLDTALPTDIANYMVVALEANGLVTLPKMFRVTNVIPQDDGERIVINAINIDTGKQDASDNVSKEDLVFQDLRGAPQPPTEIPGRQLLNVVTVPLAQGKQSTLQAAWLRPAGAYIRGFQIQYSLNGGPLQGKVEQQMAEWELALTQPGTYRVEIRTVGRDGQLSPPLVGTIDTEQNIYVADDIKYGDGQSVEDLKPAQPGATDGMNADDQVLIDQLNDDIAAAELLVASIQSTVNSDLAAFDTAISDVQADMTALSSSVQQDIQAIETEIAGINPSATPNLLENGGFENGLTGWTMTGTGANWAVTNSSTQWGLYARTTTASGTLTLYKDVPATAGQEYTLAADVAFFATSGTAYVDMLFLSAANAVLLDAGQTDAPVSTNFDVTDASRKTYKCTATAPTNTTQVRVRFVVANPVGLTLAGVRRIKLEAGDKATSFTSDASSYTAYQTGISNTGAIAALNSTVSTLNSTVSTQATSISTLTSGLATLTTTVNASSNPNLLQNGGFENGLTGWTHFNSGTLAPTIANWTPGFWANGNTASCTTPWAGGGAEPWRGLVSAAVGTAAGVTHTLTGEIDATATAVGATAWIQFKWNLSGGGSSVSDGLVVGIGTARYFSEDGSGRLQFKNTAVAPANTTSVQVKLVVYAPSGVTVNTMHWRQIKLERGSIATPYSGEATASQMFSAYSTLNSSFSSLSSTVSTQGSSISTLQSSMTSAQGSIATLETGLRVAGNPNLLSNGSFENGTVGWISNRSGWNVATNNSWGSYAYNQLNYPNGESNYLYTDVATAGGGVTYTLTYDAVFSISGGTGGLQAAVQFFDGSNALTSTAVATSRTAGTFGFDTGLVNRAASKFTFTTPANTVKLRVVFYYNKTSGTITECDLRLVKLEVGSIATAYSSDASIRSVYTVANTATSSVATLSTTVSTQGSNISTLQSAMSTAQGDVATLKTQVRTGGGNLLTNTDVAVDTSGWVTGTSGQTGVTYGRNISGDDWRINGDGAGAAENNLGVVQANATATGNADWRQYFTAEQNTWYDISVLVAAHRCNVQVYCQWINSAGAVISTPNSPLTTPASGGPNVNNWTHISFKHQAPAGTVRGLLFLRKYGTTSGGDSYAWWHRPQVVETTSGAASPVAYSVGSGRASIETVQTSVNGVLAQWVLNLDVNGYVSGMKLANNGSASSLVFRADLVQFLKPGGGASLTWSGGALIVDDGT